MMKYIQRIRGDGDIQKNEADHKEACMVKTAKGMEAFLEENMARVSTESKHKAGMSSLFVNPPGYEYLVREIDGMVTLMTAAILAHDRLALERDRTKDMVNISKDASVKLYEELEGAIAKQAQEIVKAQSEIVQVEKDIARVSGGSLNRYCILLLLHCIHSFSTFSIDPLFQ